MHTPPGGVQMPQLALQQTSPEGHTVGPHASPAEAVAVWQVPPWQTATSPPHGWRKHATMVPEQTGSGLVALSASQAQPSQ